MEAHHETKEFLKPQPGVTSTLNVSPAQAQRMIEEYEDLLGAAINLCNAMRWSYGGPDTLRALAEKIRSSQFN